MSEYHFPIPGLGDEKISLFTRRHWASFLGTIVLLVVTFLVPILLIYLIDLVFPINQTVINLMILFFACYYLVFLTFAFALWISYYCDILIVTDEEVIEITQEGFFNRTIDQISMLRIQDVSSEVRGFLPTFFNYGDVIAESAGERAHTYIIRNIPKPMEVAQKILNLHHARVSVENREDQVGRAEGDLRPKNLKIEDGKLHVTQKELDKGFEIKID